MLVSPFQGERSRCPAAGAVEDRRKLGGSVLKSIPLPPLVIMVNVIALLPPPDYQVHPLTKQHLKPELAPSWAGRVVDVVPHPPPCLFLVVTPPTALPPVVRPVVLPLFMRASAPRVPLPSEKACA